MNYLRTYKNLILKRRKNPITPKDIYCEKHHIIPRSLGGNNKKNNLIYLTAREHYIAHLLLFKIFLQRAKNPILKLKDQKLNCLYKMAHAFNSMNMSNEKRANRRDYINNSRLFEKMRLEAYKYYFTYPFTLVKKMFNFYVDNNCGANEKQFLLFKKKFNYTCSKKSLGNLFRRHNLSLPKFKKYNFELVKKMFNFYVNHNCAYHEENFLLFKQTFNYTGSKKSLGNLFRKHNISLPQKYNFALVKKMFNFYVDNNCGADEEQFLLLQQTFNYTLNKKVLGELFRRHNLSLSKQYNFELVKKMFNFYVDNNCAYNEENFLLFKQTFNYTGSKKSLSKLFKKHNLSLSKLKQYNFELVEKMFNFYIDNNCAYSEENFFLLKQEFNYTSSKSALRHLFIKHNLSLPKSKPKSLKYNLELIKKMFNFYINNNCAYSEENFLLLKQEFNYTSSKSALRHLFIKHNFSLSSLTKPQDKNYFNSTQKMILNSVCACA